MKAKGAADIDPNDGRLTIYDEDALAVKAWNLLGGLQWAGLPYVAEALGIADIERLMHQLLAIQNFQNRPTNDGS